MPRSAEDLASHDFLHFNFRRAEAVWPFRGAGETTIMSVRGPVEANSGET